MSKNIKMSRRVVSKRSLTFMKMNKKGVFFTVIVIALLSVFLISFGTYSVIKSREDINNRIATMNSFVALIEDDLPRKLYISGFRVIFLLEKRIIENGTYIDNVTLRFNETFFTGELYGIEQDENMTRGVTFSEIVKNINEKASKMNINVTLRNSRIMVSQDDPWNVKINFTTNLLIEDRSKLALWNRTFTATAFVPIENFEDPIYAVGTDANVANEINRTIYSGFGVANLSGHSINSYYINSTSGPSFLDRLEGNLGPNPNGIESMVNFDKLISAGLSIKDLGFKTTIDYIYFNDSWDPISCRVNGIPSSWYRIDDESGHFATYEVTGLTFNCV
jgi:hypothetical protein